MQMLSYERYLLSSSKGMKTNEYDTAILPLDIIIEILKRLPVKSLLRFQSVCKLWNNLIRSPPFISTHLHYSSHNNPFLLFGETRCRCNYPLLLSLDSKMKIAEVHMTIRTPLTNCLSHAVKLVGSCNGLLFVEIEYGDDDDVSFCSLFLWNPATREVRQVPESKNICSGIPKFGFGFSPVLNDYKIVRIYTSNIIYARNQHKICVDKNCVHYVEVYSLSKGTWKEVESESLNRVRYFGDFQAVISNGTMFWLGAVDEHDLHMIVSFDIARELFSFIPIPSSITPHSDSDVKLLVYENKLAMFCCPYKIGSVDSPFLDLWVMEEGNWTEKFSIGPTSDWLYPLCIWRNDIVCTNMTYSNDYPVQGWLCESEDEEWYGTDLFLSLFNLTTNEWKSHKFIDRVNYYEDIFNYAESLVCLQHPQ